MLELDPRLWIYLDNLRLGYDPSTNLPRIHLLWARAEAREKGFVSDEPVPDRITRLGQLALRISAASPPPDPPAG